MYLYMPKNHVFVFILLITIVLATGCSSDNMGNYTLYDSAWCVVQGKGTQITLLTDDKELLKPSESLDSMRFKAGDRYRVIYIPLGSKSYYSVASGAELVEVTSFQPVLVEDVIQRNAYVGTANDPVWVNAEPFFGGGFLNFDFQFYTSETGNKHGVHLLQDSLVNRKLYMKFCHDARGDSRNRTASALASFTLSSFQHLSNADSLIITMKGENVAQSFRLALRDTL